MSMEDVSEPTGFLEIPVSRSFMAAALSSNVVFRGLIPNLLSTNCGTKPDSCPFSLERYFLDEITEQSTCPQTTNDHEVTDRLAVKLYLSGVVRAG
jgi:hypothetical protein